jgi:hypothetical protein
VAATSLATEDRWKGICVYQDVSPYWWGHLMLTQSICTKHYTAIKDMAPLKHHKWHEVQQTNSSNFFSLASSTSSNFWKNQILQRNSYKLSLGIFFRMATSLGGRSDCHSSTSGSANMDTFNFKSTIVKKLNKLQQSVSIIVLCHLLYIA